jgi:hypothetical protein
MRLLTAFVQSTISKWVTSTIVCDISLFLLDKGINPKIPNYKASYQKPGKYILQEYQDVAQHQNSSRFYDLFPMIVAEIRAVSIDS